MPAKRLTACNDNSYARRLFFKEDENSTFSIRLMAYIPMARKLIKRYSQYSWKHTPEDVDYAFLEYQLCTLLAEKTFSELHRTFRIRSLAMILETNPLKLMNDPSFPV